MNFYKRYMGDYGRGTGHLSLQDHGAYTLLLDHYYSTKLPLPADPDALRRICKAITEAETKSVLRVADEFFPVGKDKLRHNKRCDEEVAKAADFSEIQRLKISKRWDTPGNTGVYTGVIPSIAIARDKPKTVEKVRVKTCASCKEPLVGGWTKTRDGDLCTSCWQKR